jgi:glycosyltransferase involved in cell wall biosynthesis
LARILFIAYHFPPIGGAGVQRNGKFARYLHEFGFDATVITGPGSGQNRWSPVDETMLEDVASSVTVVRLDGPEPRASTGWRARGERWLAMRTPWLKWLSRGVVEKGLDHGIGCDLIYASLEPYEVAVAAAELSRRLGKPWVADLQDPWVLDEMKLYPSGVHRRLDLRLMRRVLGTASAIVMNTPEAAERLQRHFPEFRGRRVVSITNGFDAADFDGPDPSPPSDVFRIVHTGYLHTALGTQHRRSLVVRKILGGGYRNVDILTRSHVLLLQAVESLIAAGEVAASEVEILLAGVSSDSDLAASRTSRIVKTLGYLPHQETIALMRSADLLFLPMHKLPRGSQVGIVPGKTYEYMASGRPILAAVPEGDVRTFLTENGTAAICEPDDVDAMAAILRDRITRKRDGVAHPITWNRDSLLRFERRELTRCLAEVFDAVLGREAEIFVPRV